MQSEGKLPEGVPKKYSSATKAYGIIVRCVCPSGHTALRCLAQACSGKCSPTTAVLLQGKRCSPCPPALCVPAAVLQWEQTMPAALACCLWKVITQGAPPQAKAPLLPCRAEGVRSVWKGVVSATVAHNQPVRTTN